MVYIQISIIVSAKYGVDYGVYVSPPVVDIVKRSVFSALVMVQDEKSVLMQRYITDHSQKKYRVVHVES